jgi:hypothetical protein
MAATNHCEDGRGAYGNEAHTNDTAVAGMEKAFPDSAVLLALESLQIGAGSIRALLRRDSRLTHSKGLHRIKVY